MTQVQVEAYARRIGYAGPPEPPLPCLKGLHRAPALSVPYENLDAGGVTCLTGRVLGHKTASGTTKRLVGVEEFEGVLAASFGIRGVPMAALWPKVQARHHALFGDRNIEQIDCRGS